MMRNDGMDTVHDVWVDRESYDQPMVLMANADDPYYYEEFKDRGEIADFIRKLEKARDEAWPAKGGE